MHKSSHSEWLLARFVGEQRAAAILGDLLEISTNRGRLWLWAAYLQTLIQIGWRTFVAFLCAYAFSTWVAMGGFPTIRALFGSFSSNIHRKAPQAIWHIFVRSAHHTAPFAIWHVPLGDSLIALWFILPFVLVRFGFRDRLTQLAAALFLLTMPFFSLSPIGVNFAGFVTAALILASLCLNGWRRPMVVLIATVAPVAVAILVSPKVWYLFLSRGYGFDSPQLQWATGLYRVVELSLAAIVCSFLYRRLLQKKSADRGSIA